MNPRLKRTYRDKLHVFFMYIHRHSWYQRLVSLPFWLRIVLASMLFIFGIIGLLTPIPAGWVMIVTAAALVFGLRIVRRISVRGFFFFRLHKVIEYIRKKSPL